MRIRRLIVMGLIFGGMLMGMLGCSSGEKKDAPVKKSVIEHGITSSKVRVYGRNELGSMVIRANWINSGIEIHFKGEKLDLEINCPDYQQDAEPYIQVWIDGERESRIMMKPGNEKYTVAKGLKYGEHKVKVLMVTESYYTPLSFMRMTITSSEGESMLLAPESGKDEMVFDFYGDSITAGFGTIPGYPDGYRTKDQDSSLTYAYRTAEHFGADANFVAISGWGCYQGYGGDRNGVIPRIWRYASMSSGMEWDFSGRDADIVVVSLGTNDAWFWTEQMPKQDFIDSYLAFLSELRQEYPKAQFYCLHGMMDESFRDIVKEAAHQYSEKDSIGAVYVDMPNMGEKPEYTGSGGHPSGEFGAYASTFLIKAIEENYKN